MAGRSDGLSGGRLRWRSEALLLIGLLLAGVLVAVVWRLLVPHTVHLGDNDETAAAVDSTLALLGVVAGLLTSAAVLFRPGSTPTVRATVAIVGACLGAVVSWQVGNLLGSPNLRAVGAADSWPLTTALLLFLGALLPGTSHRLQPPEDRRAYPRAGVGPSSPSTPYPTTTYPTTTYPAPWDRSGSGSGSGPIGDAGEQPDQPPRGGPPG